MKKNVIYIGLLVLILLVVSGIWYVKQSQAAKLFSYQDVVYSCEEIQKAIAQSATIIKIAPGADGNITLTHDGQEYKCKIAPGDGKADVVLGQTGEAVKVVLSDAKGNDVEVKNGQVKVGADGNAVVVDEKGVSIRLQDGGIVEADKEGNVNINVPGVGSVKTNGGNVQVKTNDASVNTSSEGAQIKTNDASIDTSSGGAQIKTKDASIDTSGGGIKINTPETGAINIPSF